MLRPVVQQSVMAKRISKLSVLTSSMSRERLACSGVSASGSVGLSAPMPTVLPQKTVSCHGAHVGSSVLALERLARKASSELITISLFAVRSSCAAPRT